MGGARQGGDSELDVRLLGPLEVLRAGSPIPVGGPKPRALLAVLALEPGRVVSVDRIVESLWPGESPESAMHAVQVYVSQLRKALGATALATRAPGYVLELDPSRVDLHRFVRLSDEGRAAQQSGDSVLAQNALREALALWRGPALADFLYEPFAQIEIARLDELRTVALEERIEADLALGRHIDLVPELEALVQAQPLRERPRAQLMLALYRSGRQVDALAVYRAARDTLVDELGIDPGAELRRLEAAILRQDESLLLPQTAPSEPAMQFRRLVTILFCDVVESMALADALDPEAFGTVLRRYFETVSAALTRHGGTIEKFAGDAVMAAFGIPVTHEDDALRAARAAIEIQAGIADLGERLVHEHGVGLEARIGIAAGEVVATPTETRQRFVAGDAVGVAARLEQAAGSGEIVVGEVVARLIDHAARLEPLGELEVGRRAPIRMFRLVEITPVAPTFERRLDAPLVGRSRELAALRRSLKKSVEGDVVRVSLVVGPPGVGKSRLAAELTRRAKGVTALWGRCLSYGEGITYWPLHEIVRQAPPSDEAGAILAALEAETPPAAPEIAWLFRQLCEALAREKPLVLVFDDVHWAEPTLLELIEHLTDKAEGAILVVCLAREELTDERPEFLEGKKNVDHGELEALTGEEAGVLFEHLGGAVLESDQRDRIVEAAEGNPFFLEQLLALAIEGGLVERALPATVHALLAARLDRLGPGERAVLERAAVVGKEFSGDDVVTLLDPQGVPTAAAHLKALADRGFVRPAGEGAFRFRHVLVQQAVYRASPKRLRAELHERYADHLDRVAQDAAELDEFVGYHLEQSYRHRVEIGESGSRTQRLAVDAGRRLGDAGMRAAKRGDVPASVNLLRRATSLVPAHTAMRCELLCELGIALRASGDFDGAGETMQEAIEQALRSDDRRIELRARMELEYIRLPRTPGATADALLDAAATAIPFFEAAGDDRSLGRSWLFAGWVNGGRRGHHGAREEAAERALLHYKRSTWPTASCLGEIAVALYFGPRPVAEAIARCEELLERESSDRVARANVEVFLGGLVAQLGDFDEARDLIASARTTYDELGQRTAAAHNAAAILGEVELLAGNAVGAEEVVRSLCEELERTRAYSHLASRAGDLAEALYAQGRLDEAAHWTVLAETHSAADDLDARVLWMPVRAKIMARREEGDEAETLAWEAVRLAERSDALNRHAKARLDLAEVLRLADRRGPAREVIERALRLYEEKGNIVGMRRAREVLDDVALV